jgi:hypothetical protein
VIVPAFQDMSNLIAVLFIFFTRKLPSKRIQFYNFSLSTTILFCIWFAAINFFENCMSYLLILCSVLSFGRMQTVR